MTDPIPINIAVEDELSEWVVRRALLSRPSTYAVRTVFSRGGFGQLKKQAGAFNNAAKACPFLLLTDLDKAACAPQLIKEWLPQPKHPHFLIRVAVREVETWLLGDSKALGGFLGLRTALDFPNPERLIDPKQEFLRLATKSPRRSLREALVWKDAVTGRLSQGPDYNGPLAEFVRNEWDLQKATRSCDSLNRLMLALESMETRLAK